MTEGRKLYRSRDDRVIAGVCGGLGEYFDIDPVFIRIIALVLLFAGGSAFIIYIVMAIVVPEKPVGEAADAVGATPPPAPGPDEAAAAASAPSIPSASATATTQRAAGASHPTRAARNAGLIGGLVMIGIGVTVLIAQFVPAITWWNMWPLIIIVVGIVHCVTPGHAGWSAERFFGGLGTIAAGLLLLGNVTGYISWGAWWVLLTLWPLLLISIGLSLLAKGLHQSWLRAIGSLVILAAFAYAAAVAWVGPGGVAVPYVWPGSSNEVPFEYSDSGRFVTDAKLKVDVGGASIKIGSGEELITATGESPGGSTIGNDRAGTSAEYTLTSDAPGPIVLGPEIIGAQMDVALGTKPAWDIAIDTGAASLSADLTELTISSFVLSSGVSNSIIKLGQPSAGNANVPVVAKSGVGTLDLSVPEGVEARLDVSSGLTGTDVRGRFSKVGDHWETPGYSSAGQGYAIRVESGVGSVAVTAN